MEAVGFAASVLTLAATALQTSRVIDELIRNYAECPEALVNLTTSVQHLERLIACVRDLDEPRLKDHGGHDTRLFEDSKTLVEDCTRDLLRIQQKLEELGPVAEKRFRARMRKAIQRMNHEGVLDKMWKQVLHYTQHFSALLTRVGM